MAKPGKKEVKENKHKIDINGVLIIKDNVVFIDTSEDGNGDIKDLKILKDEFIKFNGEFVSFKLHKAEVEEIE